MVIAMEEFSAGKLCHDIKLQATWDWKTEWPVSAAPLRRGQQKLSLNFLTTEKTFRNEHIDIPTTSLLTTKKV